MEEEIKHTQESYSEFLLSLVEKKVYAKIEYVTEIHEFYRKASIIKEIKRDKEGKDYLVLASGEEIRLDRLKRVEGELPPAIDGGYFHCEC